MIARAIHNLSVHAHVRQTECCNTGLLESELSGHERGAFTGAIGPKIGRFELAHGGTLFLDEVGDIPLELQSKFLRVLQEQEFERLGSTRTIRVDIRLVAATNRDLAAMVAEKQFRSDLYYRLNVFPIVSPPLRDRRDDIPPLVRYFTQRFARRMNKQIDTVATDTMTALSQYSWPGNIRELENFVERAVILSRGSRLDVPLAELTQRIKEPADVPRPPTTLEDAEREHIRQALQQANWHVVVRWSRREAWDKRTTLQRRWRSSVSSDPRAADCRLAGAVPARRLRRRHERLPAHGAFANSPETRSVQPLAAPFHGAAPRTRDCNSASRGTTAARHVRPRHYVGWPGHVGHWRQRLDLRLGSAEGLGIARGHQASSRSRHQLDRHRRGLRTRSCGNDDCARSA